MQFDGGSVFRVLFIVKRLELRAQLFASLSERMWWSEVLAGADSGHNDG